MFFSGNLVAEQPESLDKTASVLLTLEGTIEVRTQNSQEWLPGRTNQVLNVGDSLRSGARSRATVRLSDLSVLRVNELTTLDLLPAKQKGGTPFLDFKSGSAYFFNRTKPMDTQFRTPLVVGAIRGTEFNLEAGDGSNRTVVSLIEGEVALNNTQGETTLKSGEQGIVEPGQAPKKTALLEVASIIQWTLYYPAILEPAELNLGTDEKNALSKSLTNYREGDLLAALAAYPNERHPSSDAERIYHAALLLSVGQVKDAEAELGSLSSAAPQAVALRRLVATVKNQALPPTRTPQTATEWLAESYHLQAQSNLGAALQAADAAAKQAPDFGFAWERVAELKFSFRHNAEAKSALERSLQLSPRNAQAHALRGFLLAAENRTSDAIASFDRAIAIDGALGNAWLGRGLCHFRQGDPETGRRDLQVAAASEPNRSELRSYLGKGWYESGNLPHARKELRLAEQMDPNDPTPWLYSAFIDADHNQINEAVEDLEKTKALNNNRSVYRSRLLLDEDQAVRNANLARIYRDAGMPELSVREAARAVDYDYGNYSAHLFLAESYDALRDPKQVNLRYETPWFSELLVANLLAPVGAGSLSQNVSQQDYSRLFEGNYLGFSSGTEYSSRGDWVENASQYGTIDNSSYALDGFYRSQNGNRPNNDVREFDFSGKFKQQLTPADSILIQAQYMNYRSGDVRQNYDNKGVTPGMPSFSRTLRVTEVQDPNVFAGYHHEWSPGVHTLLLFGRLQDHFTQEDPNAPAIITTKNLSGAIQSVSIRPATFDFDSELEAYSGEAQQVFQTTRQTLVVGGRFQKGGVDTHSFFVRSLTNDQRYSLDLERASAYAYYSVRPLEQLELIGGLSYDYLKYPDNSEIPPINNREQDKAQVSPKAGLRWSPFKDTTFRGIYSRSLGGIFYDTSVRLEPTQIAGFNQAFRSILPESVGGLVPGSEFEIGGVAFDQNFKTHTYFSVSGEMLASRGSRTVGTLDAFGPLLLDQPSGVRQTLHFEEKTLTITLNQLVGKQFALGATYRLSEGDLEDRVPAVPAFQSANFSSTANRDVSATLQQLTLYALFNARCGFYSRFESAWYEQSNSGYAVRLGGDDFWQFNAFVGYRFPRRVLAVELGVLNLTDRDYKLNPLNLYAELPRERTLVVSLKLNF